MNTPFVTRATRARSGGQSSMHVTRLIRVAFVCLTVVTAVSVVSDRARAQTGQAGAQEQTIQIHVTASDYAAARGAGRMVHTTGALRPEGGHHPSKTFKADSSGTLVEVTGDSRSSVQSTPATAAAAATSAPSFTGPGYYPADLSLLTTTGQVITRAQIHNIYVNCGAACWGDPTVFENRLFSSRFIHVVDQYIGTDDGRYRLGASLAVNYPITKTLVTAPLIDDNDLDAILHAAAMKLGGGYNHIYHIFLPKGVDECFGVAPPYTTCFSPDSLATWQFCAFHGYGSYPDVVGNVYATVEPYPDVFAIDNNGLRFYACDVGQPSVTTNTSPTPNGVLVDTVSNFVSHETFETITDPDGTEWQALDGYFGYLPGIEIGDVCELHYANFLFTPFNVSGHLYEIAPEYSNTYHACVTVP
jgi:hypothetical protein